TMTGFFQNFGGPLIQALARRLSCDQSRTVNLGRHMQHKLSGSRLLRPNPLFFAVVQERFDCGLELGYRFAMKADHGVQTKNAADENIVAFVELDSCRVPLVIHGVHGLIAGAWLGVAVFSLRMPSFQKSVRPSPF